MIQTTSINAYDSILQTMGNRECEVYNAIKKNEPVTNEEIATILGLRINSVTGRTNSLVTKRLVTDNGLRKQGSSGRSAIAWELIA